VLIVTRLNVENIIVLGSANPSLPRIILEDTRFNDVNAILKKNIVFKRVDVCKDIYFNDPSQISTLKLLSEENMKQA